MFLEGIWGYNITQSEDPMGTTNGMSSNLANTSITFTLIEEIVETNNSIDETENSTENVTENNTQVEENNSTTDEPNSQEENDSNEENSVQDNAEDSTPEIPFLVIGAGGLGLLLSLLILAMILRRQ